MTAGNNSGEPDIFGIFNGRHVEIEVKIGDNKPTPLQLNNLRKWQQYGAIVGCVWSLKDVYLLLYPHCKTKIQVELMTKWYDPKTENKLLKEFWENKK